MSEHTRLFRTDIYPYAGPAPVISARIRSRPEDFIVDEVLGLSPDGEGEHLLVRVRKRERNSYDVIQWLSQRMGVARRDVGFCGLKDRVAVTSQWFSLPVRENQPVPQGVSDGVQIIESVRHSRKLRRGQHKGNRFEITLRDLSPSADGMEQRFDRIVTQGVPNYFGPQRFGRDGENVDNAMAMLEGRYRPRNPQIKGILLSSLRSFLFNEILAERVGDASWNRPLQGDVFHDDADATPLASVPDAALALRRCNALEIHPTAVLAGPGDSAVAGEAAALEAEVLARHTAIRDALLNKGPAIDRRPLRIVPTATSIRYDSERNLVVAFELGRGSFATSLLRELVNDSDSQPPWRG